MNLEGYTQEFALSNMIKEGNLFIADSGASCHMVHSEDGLFDAVPINGRITIGNGQSIAAVKQGKFRGY